MSHTLTYGLDSGRTYRTIHASLSVRGALRWNRRKLGRIFRVAGGRWATADEAQDQLFDALAAGNEVLPIGDPCDGFDPKKGCPGHDMPQATSLIEVPR